MCFILCIEILHFYDNNNNKCYLMHVFFIIVLGIYMHTWELYILFPWSTEWAISRWETDCCMCCFSCEEVDIDLLSQGAETQIQMHKPVCLNLQCHINHGNNFYLSRDFSTWLTDTFTYTAQISDEGKCCQNQQIWWSVRSFPTKCFH